MVAENRNGWDSTGTYLGNDTDTRLSLGINLDLLNTQVGMAGWVNHVGAGVTLRF